MRTKETENRYFEDKKNGKLKDLWTEPAIYEDEDCRIIENEYPYDVVAKDHLILLSKEDPTVAFTKAREYAIKHDYDYVLWNTPKNQSVPEIIHIHILRKYV